jgi:predicted DNA-binding protein YlxM (UPF0122 family)
VAKKTYKDFVNLTAEEIKAKSRKQQRLPAMAFYIQNDYSLEEVSELLNIPFGTIKDWAKKDEWAKTKEEIENNIKQNMKTIIEKKHTKQLVQTASNLLQKFAEAVENVNTQLVTTKDVKQLSEALEKSYKMLSTLNVIEEPAQKVQMEHSGEVKHDISEYERKLNKFNSMLDAIFKKEEEGGDSEG